MKPIFGDVTAFDGSDDAKCKQFLKIFQQIHNRLNVFSNLSIESLDRQSLQHQMTLIGQQKLETVSE